MNQSLRKFRNVVLVSNLGIEHFYSYLAVTPLFAKTVQFSSVLLNLRSAQPVEGKLLEKLEYFNKTVLRSVFQLMNLSTMSSDNIQSIATPQPMTSIWNNVKTISKPRGAKDDV